MDELTVDAYVEACSGDDGVEIMNFDFSFTPIDFTFFVFIVGRYGIESFCNEMNCKEQGIFIGWGM